MSQVKDLPIATGGLMRCCIATLDAMAEQPCHEGQEVCCQWCKDGRMVLHNNHWKWNRSAQ